jgi:hypothetical protein
MEPERSGTRWPQASHPTAARSAKAVRFRPFEIEIMVARDGTGAKRSSLAAGQQSNRPAQPEWRFVGKR